MKNRLSIPDMKASLHLSWLYLYRILTEKRRWSKNQNIYYNQPHIFFGHDHIPKRNCYSSGALIKLQDLIEEFPNCLSSANILYLVSSALPACPEIMVREAKKHGALFVLNQNGVAYPGWHGPGWEKSNVPMRILLNSADYVIYQSKFCKVSADIFLGQCRSPWTILYNPVDTKLFHPNEESLPGLKLLLAGSHQQFYRIQSALEMIRLIIEKIPYAKLTVAGRYAWRDTEKECLEDIHRLTKEMGISDNISIPGRYTQEEAPGLFQQHHILVHTQYNDCCPRLVVEAIASGLPVVFSKSGGVPELVGEEAGFGVDAPLDWENIHSPSPADLADATLRIASDLLSYSHAARKRAVERFDVRLWRDKHAEIFRELLEKNAIQ